MILRYYTISITQFAWICYNSVRKGTIMTQSLQNYTQSPLIGIIFEENGQEVVRYFTEEKAADAAVSQSATQEALDVIGAWSDLDWNKTVQALDKIRHESKPTPPIKL
jgi:hypothetical protein